MLKTAQQLWWDEDFILKRMYQQKAYLAKMPCVKTDSKDWPRYVEVRTSALYISRKLVKQLEQIKKLK